jgi:outer membrane protein assembly factor BamB
VIVAALAAGGSIVLAILYQFFGLRYQPNGSGLPRLAFVTPLERQTSLLEQHRAAQRATGAPVVTAPDLAAAPSEPGASGSSGTSASPPPEAAAPVAALLGAPERPATGAWTDFRGPRRDGVYREQPVLTTWPAGGLTPLWKQPVGGGYAAFVTANGRAFTIEQRGREEVVAAYDVATGRELWTQGWPGIFQESMGGDGPRATPTWSAGLVYALGARGELRCLDETTGRVVWRTNILEDSGAANLDWGMAASPLVVNDAVVVLPGGPNGQSIVAYDRRTGARLWSTQDDRAAYASPMRATIADRDQLLILSAERLMGLTTDGREVLWSYPWVTNAGINVSQPLVIGDNRVFISSGYGVGAAVIEVAAEAAGMRVREVWRNTRMKNKFTSSVLHDGFIYGLDEAILACVDAATGELRWKGGRYGYGQIVLAGDRIIVLTEDGDLVLVAATPARHQELASFPALGGKTWNHLAIDDGRLLVRNLSEMAAFDLLIR